MGFSSSGTSEVTPVLKWFAAMNSSFMALTGTWVVAAGATDQGGGHIVTSTNTQNDEVGFGSFLIKEAGNYTLYFIHGTNPGYAIAHFMLNGVDTAEIDCYTAGGVSNVHTSVSLGTLTAGDKTLSVKLVDKNASSSAFEMYFYSIIIVKT